MIIKIQKLNILLNRIFGSYPFGIYRQDGCILCNFYFFQIIFFNKKYWNIVEKPIRCGLCGVLEKEWNTPEEDAAWKNL